MAARQLVREHFQRSPTLVCNKVKERLAQARRKPGVGDLEPRDMYLHFQETVLLGSFKTLTYVSFLLCTAWEAMENGRGDEVASIIARGLVFCEQVANESGHTRLAWLLTPRRSSVCFGRISESPSCRSPTRDVSGPEVDSSPAGVCARCPADTGEDKCSARTANHGSAKPSGRSQRPWKARQRCAGGERRRAEVVSGDTWFLPQIFPSGLDDSLSASTLCSFIRRFLLKAKCSLSTSIFRSFAQTFSSAASQSSRDLWPCPLPPTLEAPQSRLVGGPAQSAIETQAPVQTPDPPPCCREQLACTRKTS